MEKVEALKIVKVEMELVNLWKQGEIKSVKEMESERKEIKREIEHHLKGSENYTVKLLNDYLDCLQDRQSINFKTIQEIKGAGFLDELLNFLDKREIKGSLWYSTTASLNSVSLPQGVIREYQINLFKWS